MALGQCIDLLSFNRTQETELLWPQNPFKATRVTAGYIRPTKHRRKKWKACCEISEVKVVLDEILWCSLYWVQMWTGLSEAQWLGKPPMWRLTGWVCVILKTHHLCLHRGNCLYLIDSSGLFVVFSIQDHDCPGHSFILSPGVNIDNGGHMRSELVCLAPSHSLVKYQRLAEYSNTAARESAKPSILVSKCLGCVEELSEQ